MMRILVACFAAVLIIGGCSTTTGPDGPTGMVLSTFNYSVGDRAVFNTISIAPIVLDRLDTMVINTITGSSGAQTITYQNDFYNSQRIIGINLEMLSKGTWYPVFRVGSKAGDTLHVWYDTLRSGVLDTISQIYTNRVIVVNPDTTITIGLGDVKVGTMLMSSTPSNEAGVGPVSIVEEVAAAPLYGVVRTHTRVWAGKVPSGAPFVEKRSEFVQIIRK